MAKCSNIIGILFISPPHENVKSINDSPLQSIYPVGGFMRIALTQVGMLYASRQIGSPFLSYNFLGGKFWERPWFLIAAGLGLVGGLKYGERLSLEQTDLTLAEHASRCGGALVPSTFNVAQAIGNLAFGYVFPRLNAFSLTNYIGFCIGAGAAATLKELKR